MKSKDTAAQQGNILSCPYADHLILYQRQTRRLCALNESGRFVWEMQQQGADISTITRRFSEAYDIPLDQATRDVNQCLQEWRMNGLLASGFVPEQADREAFSQYSVQISEMNQVVPALRRHKTLWLAGVTVRLGFGDEFLENAIAGILGHLLDATLADVDTDISVYRHEQNYRVAVDGRLTHEGPEQDEAIASVVYELVEQTYNGRGCMVVLHGGALACGDSSLVFPGSQGSGKSTLVAALQTEGFDYLADDVCPIDDGLLVPVPMSQALKQGSWNALDSCRPELKDQAVRRRLSRDVRYLPPLSGTPAAWKRSWPVGSLIYPKYDPDSQFSCRPLDAMESIQYLIHSDSVFSDQLPQILSWVESTPAYSLTYPDIQQAIAGVKQLVKQLGSISQ